MVCRKAITIAEARLALPRFTRQAAAGRRFLLTAHGRPEAVLIGYRDFLALSAAGAERNKPGAIILAGKIDRLGSRSLQDRRLSRHIASLRRAGVEHMALILPKTAGEPNERVLRNPRLVFRAAPNSRDGFAPSLKKGLRLLHGLADPVVVVFATQPPIRIDTLQTLLKTYRRKRPPAVQPVMDGRGGHPILLGMKLIDEALRMDPRRGLVAVMRRHRGAICRVSVDDPNVLKNRVR